MMKLAIMLVTVSILAGCTTTQKTKYISSPAPTLNITEPQLPRPISTKKVRIVIYDKAKLQEALEDPNFRRTIGLTDTDYRNIVGNYEEAIRYIESQAIVIDYYRKVIKELRDRKIVQ